MKHSGHVTMTQKTINCLEFGVLLSSLRLFKTREPQHGPRKVTWPSQVPGTPGPSEPCVCAWEITHMYDVWYRTDRLMKKCDFTVSVAKRRSMGRASGFPMSSPDPLILNVLPTAHTGLLASRSKKSVWWKTKYLFSSRWLNNIRDPRVSKTICVLLLVWSSLWTCADDAHYPETSGSVRQQQRGDIFFFLFCKSVSSAFFF